MAQNRKEHDERMARVPFDRRGINYVLIGPDEVVPAVFDKKAEIEFRWRGVTLLPGQIPDLGKDGSSIIPMLVSPSGYPVRYVDPPLRFLPLAGDRFAVGYHDRSHGTFFQINGRIISKSQLPANADADDLIVPATVSASLIDAPKTGTGVPHAHVPPTASTRTYPTTSTTGVPATSSRNLPFGTDKSSDPNIELSSPKAAGSQTAFLYLGAGTLLAAILVTTFTISRWQQIRLLITPQSDELAPAREEGEAAYPSCILVPICREASRG